MIIKAQKRKHPPEEVEESDRSSPTWESQRQFVFSVSLNKYQSGQVLPEPSLRRSVLIANTLRLMSLEDSVAPSADVQVSPSPCDSPPGLWESTFAGGAAMSSEIPSALDGCPPGSSNFPASRCSVKYHPGPSNVSMSVRDEDEDWGSMSTDSDYSLSAAITSILTALDSIIDGSPQATPRTPLRSLENLMGPCEGAVAWAKQGGKGYAGSWEQQVESSDLFQDIDTSLLERDMGVLGLIGNGGGYQTRDDFYQYQPPLSSPYTPCPSLATRI
ncbi:SERTA domain-containing protein 3 isoform 1-T3 [Spinachia spinachia]